MGNTDCRKPSCGCIYFPAYIFIIWLTIPIEETHYLHFLDYSFFYMHRARCSSVVRAFAHGAMGRRIDPSGVNPLSYFSFQPVLHDWCNKGRGMCYPVCGMVHIEEPLLLIGKSSPCFLSHYLSGPLPLLCPTPYNRK